MVKIANLEVFIDLEDTEGTSTSEMHNGDYKITLRPNNRVLPWRTTEEGRVVLAHELGHFVANLTRAENHTIGRMAELLGISISQIPQEQEAWKFAELIAPEAKNAPIRAQALATYKKAEEEN